MAKDNDNAFGVIPLKPGDIMNLVEAFADYMANQFMTDAEQWNALTEDVVDIVKLSDIPPREAIICLLRIACTMYQTAKIAAGEANNPVQQMAITEITKKGMVN